MKLKIEPWTVGGKTVGWCVIERGPRGYMKILTTHSCGDIANPDDPSHAASVFSLGETLLRQGVRIHIDELFEGMHVVADAGFTCMVPGGYIVHHDEVGYYLKCAHGKHHLDGQCDDDGILIGLRMM